MYEEFLKNKNIIVDTNVLLEYFYLLLGSKKGDKTNKKKDQFIRYIYLFRGKNLYVVPQNFSELYSLLKRDAKNKKKKEWFLKNMLKELHPYLEILKEEYVPKEEILNIVKFLDFGFTDIALFKLLSKGNRVLLSMDYNFVRYCKSKGFIACHPEEIFTF